MSVTMKDAYWVCADLLMLGAKIAESPDMPPVETMQRRIDVLLDQMATNGKAAGMTDDDVVDARYAMCAFIDEQVLRHHPEARAEWLPHSLQIIYFNENSAGEGFFARLSLLKTEPGRAAIAQIYFLCVAFGFTGTYARSSPESLHEMTVLMGESLVKSLTPLDPLASVIATDLRATKKTVRAEAPLVLSSLSLLLMSLLVVLGLRITAVYTSSKAAHLISEAVPSHVAKVRGFTP